MKNAGLVLFLLVLARGALGQTFPTPGYLRQMVSSPVPPAQVKGAQELATHVVEGRLRLTLGDAIRLTLLNNTEVRLNELQVENARNQIIRTYQPFDPVATSSFTASHDTTPTYTQLDGAPTLSSLAQTGSFSYTQMFQTGTSYELNFTGNKSASNSVFNTFNPTIFSSASLTLTQPLLRNRGLFPNRAQLVIARRNLNVTRETFESQLNDSLAQAIQQYWSVVQARKNLEVTRKSLEQAQASYDHDRRALELGALPPFDIYRSESQVAARRVLVIQAEYGLKQQEDEFRRLIGADLDPHIRALDLNLVENAEPAGELLALDVQQVYDEAIRQRPDLAALGDQLLNSDTNIRLAHNSLLPDLSLSAFYSANGLGGNQLDTSVTPPRVISTAGFLESLSQIRSFNFPSYGFTVQLRLPIRNRSAQADLGDALVSKRRNLYRQRQLTQALWQEAKNAVHDLDQAKLSMAAAKIARDLAEKTLEAEQRKYELGASQIFFVLDAQTQLAAAEVNLVQARVSYQRAVTEVDLAQGTLLQHHNVKVEDAMQ
jgi:outer membrane protein